MKRLHLLALACALWLMVSCGGGEKMAAEDRAYTPAEAEKKTEATAPQQKDEAPATPPMATNSNLKQTNRDFIRTADARFQVKNVYKTTLELEKMVADYKGFITENNLSNQITKTEEIEVSRDSILRVVLHQVNNTLTIRLPQDSLDPFLHKIGKWLVFLDHRIVRADDVTLALKAHTQKANRSQEFEKRYTNAIDKKPQDTKLGDATHAEDNLLQRQNEIDQNLSQREGLQDQVAYSTLKLQIYQPETIHKSLIENYRKIEQYQPSFWSQMGDSLARGWQGLLKVIVALTNLWVFFVIGLITLGVYARFAWSQKK
jgi:hypothetical protein